jgi:hypothetical protein
VREYSPNQNSHPLRGRKNEEGEKMVEPKFVVHLASVVIAVFLMTACSGDDSTSPSSTHAAGQASVSSTSTADSARATGTGNAQAGSTGAAEQFTVNGTFKNSPVEGTVDTSAVFCVDVGSQANPSREIQWSGTIGSSPTDANRTASGEINSPPGTYQAGGKGLANIVIAGDYQNSPEWTAGSYTINADKISGSVDLIFGTLPEQTTVKGDFKCASS